MANNLNQDLLIEPVRPAPDQKPPQPAVPSPPARVDLNTFLHATQPPPSLPAIYNALMRALDQPDSAIASICEIILQDPALTSRLLRLANSALFGTRSSIDTVESAVQLVGLGRVQELVLATSLIKSFEGLPTSLVDIRAFWEHSLVCGMASSLLAEHMSDPTPERFFIAGLLHDIGRLIMYVNAPDQSRTILEKCARDHQLPSPVEREVLGFDHCEIGAQLLTNWSLPKALCEAVRHHHISSKHSAVPQDAYLVHLADFVVTALQFGSSGEHALSGLVLPPARSHPLLREGVIENVLRELEGRCERLVPIFLSGESSRKPADSPAGSGTPDPGSVNGKSIVALEQLEPGMELAADVFDQDGAVLLTEGTPLTSQHLGLLARGHISRVAVKRQSLARTSFPPEIQAAAEAQVKTWFLHVDGSLPVAKVIRKAAVHRAAARLSKAL